MGHFCTVKKKKPIKIIFGPTHESSNTCSVQAPYKQSLAIRTLQISRIQVHLYALITAHLDTRYKLKKNCILIADCDYKRRPYSEGLFVSEVTQIQVFLTKLSNPTMSLHLVALLYAIQESKPLNLSSSQSTLELVV